MIATADTALIPRRKLFGNPERAMCTISPMGDSITWLAPRDGVLNVWLAPVDKLEAARPITNDTNRGIRMYAWAKNGTHILYVQDEGGDENWRVHCVDPVTGADRDLTPLSGVHAQIHGTSWHHPDHIVVGLNDRDPAWHDLYKINIVTGEREQIFLNDQHFGNFHVDHHLALRLAERTRQEEGGREVFLRNGEAWDPLITVSHEDDLTTGIYGFDATGETVYMLDSRGRDTASLNAVALHDPAQPTLVAEHVKADIGGILQHPTSHALQAYQVHYLTPEWFALSDDIADDLAILGEHFGGAYQITSHTKEDDIWIILASDARNPGEYYRYDRTGGQTLTKLFATRPELAPYPMAEMHPVVISARDGLELPSYLTLPLESSTGRTLSGSSESQKIPSLKQPLPLVLLVHGGPWARDYYGFNPIHQWLADRGLAVLSVNFRGSSGLGKSHLNAGDLEWGAKMHEDLLDAVDWAIENGIAQQDKIAIMGGSYGGYATLVGLTFTPDIFCCGVDIVGPSNLQTLLATIPPYWKSFFENFAKRVGDPRTPEGRAHLDARSPLSKVDAIAKPLLIGQGANDPRVKQAESDQIVTAMEAKGLPVIYALYPDEGHGFARPENRLSFNALTEHFLAQYLGGVVEPYGTDLDGSSLEIKAGDVSLAS